MSVPEKDTHKFQRARHARRARIERIAHEVAPGKTVEFD